MPCVHDKNIALVNHAPVRANNRCTFGDRLLPLWIEKTVKAFACVSHMIRVVGQQQCEFDCGVNNFGSSYNAGCYTVKTAIMSNDKLGDSMLGDGAFYSLYQSRTNIIRSITVSQKETQQSESPRIVHIIVSIIRHKLLNYNDVQKYNKRKYQLGVEAAVKDILSEITKYREARGWTEYQLADKAGLPQSTISSWYRKQIVPTVPSLAKICDAFGITMSQLFAEGEDSVTLTETQRTLLEQWTKLTEEQQTAFLHLIELM
jgi:transcriptional regulator with XRE-family HTH domain